MRSKQFLLLKLLVPIHVIWITISGETVEKISRERKRERANDKERSETLRLYTNSDARFFWMSRFRFSAILSHSLYINVYWESESRLFYIYD